MRKAYKAELYDAGVVLIADTEELYEHTGWDYSEKSIAYSLTGRFLSLLEESGLFDRETHLAIEEYVTDAPVFHQELSRSISCSRLSCEELPNGSLGIVALCYTVNSKEVWEAVSSYKGSYTVFWEEE